MTAAPEPSSRASIRGHLLAGVSIVLFLALFIGGWAAVTPISGAVIAPGSIVVDSHVKRVQHPSGGVVAAIRVRNGSRVAADEVLLRLDDTQTRVSLAIVEKRLDELAARQARLATERDGGTAIVFPQALLQRAADPVVADLLRVESRLFAARRAARRGERAQFRQRMAQLHEEIAGLEAQLRGKTREIELVESELAGVRALHSKGFMPVTRVNGLEREAARLIGEKGALVAGIAKARGQIAEIGLQILQIDSDLESEVSREIRDIQIEIGEFVERRIAAEDELARADVTAPQDGIVHDLSVHAPGAVVGAGELILRIVPVDDALAVEVRVAPWDIDQLQPGNAASLRFSAFNQRTTPEIPGTVERIGADLTGDAEGNPGYYLVRIATMEEERARLGALRLVPGMPVEAFIRTGERTALSYLVKPLADQIARAFREE